MEDFLSVVVVDTKRNQPLEKGEKIKESLPQGPEEGEKYERRKKASTTINAGEPGQGWANVFSSCYASTPETISKQR